MKTIVFDTGPIISLTMNNLLWILNPMKQRFKGEFCVCERVKKELVDKPLETKKFKFEALQIMSLVNDKTFSVVSNDEVSRLGAQLSEIADNIYVAKGHPIKIVHSAEMESLATAMHLNASAFVVDERTTRKLLEEPLELQRILKRKLHTPVETRNELLAKFKKLTNNVRVLRSFELVTIAYEMGLLDIYLPKTENPKRMLLEAVLWGLKLDGCAVSQEEIEGTIVAETRR
jgi:hypothetical protein